MRDVARQTISEQRKEADMDIRTVETRYEALDAIGHALKQGHVSFAEASRLRDLARIGRVAEVKQHLTPLEKPQRS